MPEFELLCEHLSEQNEVDISLPFALFLKFYIIFVYKTFFMHFPTLDQIVLDTIDLYISRKDLPKIDLSQLHTPLVVGSGNGFYTGRILFRNSAAYFAVEAEVEKKLENIPSITDVIVVSASGEKHAPIILNAAKKHEKKTFLISSSEVSTGRSMADDSVIMPKIREPYTYNTSTYFGYMLAEDPHIDLVKLREFLTGALSDALSFRSMIASIPLVGRNPAPSQESEQDASVVDMTDTETLSFRAKAIAEVEKSQSEIDLFTSSRVLGTSVEMTKGIDFSHFSSFFIVLPDQFVLLREMIEVKFIELFGRRVARDVFSYEQMKHATTVVQGDDELFICFGNNK